jgi:FkbM family methyltransferase
MGFHSYPADILPTSRTTFDDFIDLNIVTNETYQCIKTKLLLNKYRTTVCVHEIKRDQDVSRLLISSGIWEEHLVTRFVRILSAYRQFAFFDIGANIGVYTMYAASLGCSNIISIECFLPNIERIRRAIQLEHVQQRVVLVSRALYNKSNAYLSLQANILNNIGSQRLTNEVSKNEHNSLVVKTIRFDDLVFIVNKRNIHEAIIKIDIETSEHFLCETGEHMFDQINIPFVMMEWANIKTIPERANLIQLFFINRHYIPFDSETCQPQNQTNYRLWKSQDIYWIKQNFRHLCSL